MNKKKLLWIVMLVIVLIIMMIIVNLTNQREKINNEGTERIAITNTDIVTSNVTIDDSSAIRESKTEVKVNKNNMIEITDNYFIQQTNDIYFNLDDYIGKTIKMEGLIYAYQDTDGDICYAVVRNTPGCCGADGLSGIDIRYDGEYPEFNTWVEVVGVMGTDTVYGSKIPAIQVDTLTPKEIGTTFVTN